MADDTNPEHTPLQTNTRDSPHHHSQDRTTPHTNPVQEQKNPEPLDDDSDDDDHARQRHRQHGGGHRGGKPAKKVYEEWANDPYCE